MGRSTKPGQVTAVLKTRVLKVLRELRAHAEERERLVREDSYTEAKIVENDYTQANDIAKLVYNPSHGGARCREPAPYRPTKAEDHAVRRTLDVLAAEGKALRDPNFGNSTYRLRGKR